MFVSKLVCVIILLNECKCEVISESDPFKDSVDEFNKILQSNKKLDGDNQILVKEIQNGSYTCNRTLFELRKTKDGLYLKALNEDQNVMELFQKVKEEESTHLKLEDLLKELYSDLDLFAEMYEVLFEDVSLLKDRFDNGTDSLCEILAMDQGFTARNAEIEVRSINRPHRKDNMDKLVLQHRLNLAKVRESELMRTLEELTRKKRSNQKMCSKEKAHLKEQIKLSKRHLDSSVNIVDIIQADLMASNILTKSFLLEIQAGTKLLNSIKKGIRVLMDLKQLFKGDEECYNQAKKF